MDAKTAQTIASVVMLTFMLTAGYFVTTIPGWISWMKCEPPFPVPPNPHCPLLLSMPPSLRRHPSTQNQLHLWTGHSNLFKAVSLCVILPSSKPKV